MISEEKCWEIIGNNFNRYFRAKYLIDLVIAEKYDIPVKYVNDCRRLQENPFHEEEGSIRGHVRNYIIKLEKEGKIVKHSYYVWKIIDGKAKV